MHFSKITNPAGLSILFIHPFLNGIVLVSFPHFFSRLFLKELVLVIVLIIFLTNQSIPILIIGGNLFYSLTSRMLEIVQGISVSVDFSRTLLAWETLIVMETQILQFLHQLHKH